MHLGLVIEGKAFVPWIHRSPFEGSPLMVKMDLKPPVWIMC